MQAGGNTTGQYSYYTSEIISRHALAAALAVSLAWHIFWIFSVKIFISAPVVPVNTGSKVSFIGSILDEGPILSAKTPGESASDVDIRRLRDLAVPADIISGGDALTGNEKLPSVSDPDILNEMNTKFSADITVGQKQIPERPFDKITVSYKTYPSEVGGPARFREVVYKPEFPSDLRWDESFGVDFDRLGSTFSIELKFWISPDGKVESVERVSSSGHPAVDIIGIRYLKGWQFAPLKPGGQKEGQWGTVKLNFSLKRAEPK